MRRRFNYTGRKKIQLQHVGISVTEGSSENCPKFSVDVDLEPYDFPNDARVVVEAYDSFRVSRHNLGECGTGLSKAFHELREFSVGEDALFRIKIVDSTEPGLLLGLADQINPANQSDEGQSKSILHLQQEDLHNQIWRLDLDDDSYPCLKINNAIELGKELARSQEWFQAVVFPEVVRQVLTFILENDYGDQGGEDDDRRWKEEWLTFAERLHGMGPRPSTIDSSDEKRFWVEEAVEAFSNKLRLLKHFRAHLEEEF